MKTPPIGRGFDPFIDHGSNRPTRHPATALNRAVGRIAVLGITADLSSKIRFVLLLFLSRFAISESPMQNLKPTHFSAVVAQPTAVSDVLDRVVGIAPPPLLPGEGEADYVNLIARVVAVARPRDAIEEFLDARRH